MLQPWHYGVVIDIEPRRTAWTRTLSVDCWHSFRRFIVFCNSCCSFACSYWDEEIPTTLLRTETRLTLHYPARRHGSLACYLGSFPCVFRPWIVFWLHLNFHETRIIYIVHLFQNLQLLFCAHTHFGEIMSNFPILTIHIAVFTLDRPAEKTRNF
jgi:hypothetical protein